MAIKVKPIQSTEIKDKKIVQQIIGQIRKPISQETIKRNRETDKLIEKFIR